jgi:hypothetical protein
VARYADTILTESRRLESLIENVLDLSRLDETLLATEVRPFDVGALLTDFRADPSLPSAATGTTWDLPDTLPVVLGDPLRLKQALLDLLRRSQTQEPDRAIRVRALTAADAASVVIEIGTPEPAAAWTDGTELLMQLDLRQAVDSPQARDDALPLYRAGQLLQAMNAGFSVAGALTGPAAYRIMLPVLPGGAPPLAGEG